MKKISYLLMPLLTLPIFTSCNNKATSKISDQDELITAVSFSNCKYSQASGEGRKGGTIECSPTVCRMIIDDEEIYGDGSYWYYYNDKKECWEKEVDEQGYFFGTPYELMYADGFCLNAYFNGTGEFTKPITYDDLKYEYENNEYVCVKQDNEGNEYNVTIKFSNKKLTYLDISSEKERSTYSFSYKHTTPKLPM